MMRYLISVTLLFAGCADKPWKPMNPPVRVKWIGGDGELRISQDRSFATLETNLALKPRQVFLWDNKVFYVGPDVGSRAFNFRYVLEAK